MMEDCEDGSWLMVNAEGAIGGFWVEAGRFKKEN